MAVSVQLAIVEASSLVATSGHSGAATKVHVPSIGAAQPSNTGREEARVKVPSDVYQHFVRLVHILDAAGSGWLGW